MILRSLENISLVTSSFLDNRWFEPKPTLKKVKKEKAFELFFDEEKDKKVLKEYDDIENDIINISLINDIRPWQIVSLLMRYKVISKRDESRGYDKYKDTEEYKNKLNKNK